MLNKYPDVLTVKEAREILRIGNKNQLKLEEYIK